MQLSALESDFDKVFTTIFGATVPSLVHSWKKQFRKHSTWIVIGTGSGTLWFLILITFIIVYIIKSNKTRKILQEWEEQEWFQSEFGSLNDSQSDDNGETTEYYDETERY